MLLNPFNSLYHPFHPQQTHQDHVYGAAFHPLDNNLIITYGKGLLSLWARRKDGIFTRSDLVQVRRDEAMGGRKISKMAERQENGGRKDMTGEGVNEGLEIKQMMRNRRKGGEEEQEQSE